MAAAQDSESNNSPQPTASLQHSNTWNTLGLMLQALRRKFLRRSMLFPSLACTFYEETDALVAEQTAASPQYDLLIRGGHVIDPSQDLSADIDIAIRQGKVAHI